MSSSVPAGAAVLGMAEAAQQEADQWRAGFPDGQEPPHDIHAPGGLPEGWEVKAFARRRLRHPSGGIALVRRERGGWLVVRDGLAPVARESFRAAETLFDLCTNLANFPANTYPRVVEHWLLRAASLCRSHLATLYDQTDPFEQGEAMLVALGGPIMTPPAADQPWGEALFQVAR